VAGALTKNAIRDNILGVHPAVGRILNWESEEDRQMLEKLEPVLRLYNPRPFRAADILQHPEPPIVIEDDDEGEPPAQPAPAKRQRAQTLAERGRGSSAKDFDPRNHPGGGAPQKSARALRIEALLCALCMSGV
jgi:hypothetical protein